MASGFSHGSGDNPGTRRTMRPALEWCRPKWPTNSARVYPPLACAAAIALSIPGHPLAAAVQVAIPSPEAPGPVFDFREAGHDSQLVRARVFSRVGCGQRKLIRTSHPSGSRHRSVCTMQTGFRAPGAARRPRKPLVPCHVHMCAAEAAFRISGCPRVADSNPVWLMTEAHQRDLVSHLRLQWSGRRPNQIFGLSPTPCEARRPDRFVSAAQAKALLISKSVPSRMM